MMKIKLSLILVIAAAISIPALADDKVVKRVPAGAVAFHFVYDLTLEPPPGELIGYVAFIEGVDSPLFAPGFPSKDTAYFTVRVTADLPPPSFLAVDRDPALVTLLFPPGGQFTIFYDADPEARDWSVPDTFSRGVPIAVFEESALLNSSAFGAFPGITFAVFSSKLIDSTPIKFNGQKLDFKRVVPNGVTITNFGNASRPDGIGAAGGGTAISIGGKLR